MGRFAQCCTVENCIPLSSTVQELKQPKKENAELARLLASRGRLRLSCKRDYSDIVVGCGRRVSIATAESWRRTAATFDGMS